MKKFIVFTFVLTLLTVSCALSEANAFDAAKSFINKTEVKGDQQEVKTIRASNEQEFLEALGSDRIIEMAPRKYNMTSPQEYNQLYLTGISNLTIRGMGEKPDETEITVAVGDALVMSFSECSDIVIENLTAGHKTISYNCDEGVFGFGSSSRITINGVNMYGCGTEGLSLFDVSDMKVTNSSIYECTEDTMSIYNGKNISFENCKFHDNNDGVRIFGPEDGDGNDGISFVNCEFINNRGENMLWVSNTNVSVTNSTFRDNTDRYVRNSNGVTFTNCEFDATDTVAAMSDLEFVQICERGTPEEVLRAIKDGANVNAVYGELNWTALFRAAYFNDNPEVTRLLIENGANINAQDRNGNTALIQMVSHHRPRHALLLLDMGANVNVTNNNGHNVLNFIPQETPEGVDEEEWNTVVARIRQGIEPKSLSDLELIQLCERGTPEEILRAIKNGANVNAVYGELDWTPLFYGAYFNDNPEVIRVLVENGANINAQDKNGNTALIQMVSHHRPRHAMLLLDLGADVDVTNNNGHKVVNFIPADTPEGVDEEEWNTIVTRIKQGAEPIILSDLEFIQLCESGTPEAILRAIKDGANVNAVYGELNWTPLFYGAYFNDNTEVAKVLVENGTNINARDNNGNTALIQMVSHHRMQHALLLLNMGADVDVTNNNGHKVVNFISADTPEGVDKEEWNKVATRIYQEFTPKNHKVYMNYESYKKSFEQLTAMNERIKKIATQDEYFAIAGSTYHMINNWTDARIKEGFTEVRAYEEAYAQRGRDIRFEWLRHNAEGVQGLYGPRENAALAMTIEKTEKNDEYAVEIEVNMNEEPYRISFIGIGKLSGAKMTMPYDNDENAFAIAFEGENAIVTTSQNFKDAHKLGVVETLDGTYERDRFAPDSTN